MSTATATATRSGVNNFSNGRLPRGTSWLLLAGSLLVMGLVFFLLNIDQPVANYNIVAAVFLGAVLYAILIFVVASIVEGRRNATDRFITAAPCCSRFWSTVLPGSTSTSSRSRCATSSATAAAPCMPSPEL